MMDTEILEDLGLTQAEIKTYLALLETGATTAGLVLEKSGLQNSVVHRALNSLIEKGLVNFVVEGKRKTYQATEPEHFITFIDDKKRRFEEILPALKQRATFANVHEAATIYKGLRGIKEVYSIMIAQKAKEYNTFGGGVACAQRMGMQWWLNLHARRVANRLPSRQVFDETVRGMGGEIEAKQLTRIRYLTADFASFQETVIVGDLVAISIFTESPYSILIRDKSVADGYRKHFELLWKQARK
jgi:sugar-specific transcriptional regulator TrmB